MRRAAGLAVRRSDEDERGTALACGDDPDGL